MRVASLVGLVCGGILVVAAARGQNAYVERVWEHEVSGTVKVAPGRFSLAATTTSTPGDPISGFVYVVGRYSSPYGASPVMLVSKVDKDGTSPPIWTAHLTIANTTDAVGIAVATDEAGLQVFVTGWYEGSNGKDIVTASLNSSNGNVLWAQRYNYASSNKDDYPVTIVWDQAGDAIYVGGVSQGSSPGGFSTGADFILLKYVASTGAVATGWSAPFRYNGTAFGNDELADVAVWHAGSIDLLYVGGTVETAGAGKDYATIWIDPSNPAAFTDELFNSSGTKNDVLTSIAVHATGPTNATVIATGYSEGVGTSTEDYWTIAYPYDLSSVIWDEAYDGAGGADRAVKVVISDNGATAFVTGESWGGSGTGYDFATAAYDLTDGSADWSSPPVKRFDNIAVSGEDRATDIVVDKNGNTYICGKSYNGSSFDYCAISYKLDGEIRWIERVGGVPTGNTYVLYDGAQNGPDTPGCIRVSRSGGPVDHVGDVFLYGLVSRSGNPFTVLKYIQEDR